MGCLSKKGQYPSTGPATYQIIKVTNANHMSVMKTSLTIIPMCPRERFSPYKSLSRLVLCNKKYWATLLHFIYFCSRGHERSVAISSLVNFVFVRYFDEMYVVFPLVVLCERRLHETSPLFGPRGRHWEVIIR